MTDPTGGPGSQDDSTAEVSSGYGFNELGMRPARARDLRQHTAMMDAAIRRGEGLGTEGLQMTSKTVRLLGFGGRMPTAIPT